MGPRNGDIPMCLGCEPLERVPGQIEGVNYTVSSNWKKLFDRHDVNSNGKIDLQEFKKMMDSIEYDAQYHGYDHETLFKMVDADGTKEIDRFEFEKVAIIIQGNV